MAERPVLVVTVDTECDDQWRLEKRQAISLANIREVPRLQALLDGFGVRPVYLVTYPVARDPEASAILGTILRDDRCEIGAHLHAWTTPPVTAAEIRDHAYLHNLAPAVQRAKMQALHAAIVEGFGVRPLSHRGGRWSLGGQALHELEELGYAVDTSVTPGLHWRDGGPDFRGAGLRPYHPAYEDVRRPGPSRILEVPVSIAFLPRGRAWLERAVVWAPPALHLEGLTRRLGLLRRIWLEPSLMTVAEMRALGDWLLASGAPVLNLMFHSSELLPGGSPYQSTREDVDRFFGRLREILAYLVVSRRLESVTLAELGRRWAETPREAVSRGGSA